MDWAHVVEHEDLKLGVGDTWGGYIRLEGICEAMPGLLVVSCRYAVAYIKRVVSHTQ